METTPLLKPRRMAELLPGLSGTLTKDAVRSLPAKKQPHPSIHTTVKVMKPMTIAEITANIQALKSQSTQKQGVPSSRKKPCNSTVKVQNKTVSCTVNGQMKHNPAKKMLNFHTNPATNSRATMMPSKFPKPEFRAKKSLALHARNNVRISGISSLAETPAVRKPFQSSITLAKKENISEPVNIEKCTTPKSMNNRKICVVPATPRSNEPSKSSCDASLLQIEEINDKEKSKSIEDEQAVENIAEVTPPISTAFEENRNNNTIMCFDESNGKEENRRAESVIVSLCDFNKAAVTTNTDKVSTDLKVLLQIEKETEHAIKMVEKNISELSKLKDSQMKSLKYVRKVINEAKALQNQDKTLVDDTKTLIDIKDTPKVLKIEKISPEKSPVVRKPCSDLKIRSGLKSPSYKIPKKNCLRKKVLYKSMPNVSSDMSTLVQADMGNKALSVYMKMKEHMSFLNTPVKQKSVDVPDTPAVTSLNLQKQLHNLYGEN